jgi:putative aldouronate transport system substrate-binding protein
MKKNLLSLLLACAMVLCLFAGCGDSSTAASSAATTDDTEKVEASVESTTEEAEAPEAQPAEAEASVAEASSVEEVSDRPEITYPLVEETTTLTYWQAWPPFLNDISQPSDASMFAAMEEITGVKLEIIAVSTETDSDDFMLRAASGDLTDLVQKGASHYTGGGAKAIEDEVLMDLLPLLDEYSVNYWNIMNSDPNIYKNVVNDEGQVPALIGMYTDYYYTDQGFWIRQDLLDAVGKETPTTVDELDDVLAAFKDYGMTDGLVVLSEGNCDLLSTAYGAGNYMDGDQVVYNGLSDNYKDYLKKLNEYYTKGYINVDFVTYNTSDTKPPEDIVYNDMAGIFNEDVASIAGYYLSAPNPDFELKALGQIKLTEDQVLDTGFVGVKAADKYSVSISTNCSDPELAIKYMDYLFSDDGFLLCNYGIEGETYTVENGEYQFTDLILNNPSGFDWQLCQSLYINPGIPCLTDLSIQEMTYNDAQKEAVDIWVAAYDSSDATMPNTQWLSYTTEESQTVADLQTDIETYQEEMRLKFITGQADIDAMWDEYCTTLENMGFYTLQEIDQAAVERYLEK